MRSTNLCQDLSKSKVQQLSFQLAQVTMGWEVRGGVEKELRAAHILFLSTDVIAEPVEI